MHDNFNHPVTCADSTAEIWRGQIRSNCSESHHCFGSQTSRGRDVFAFSNPQLISLSWISWPVPNMQTFSLSAQTQMEPFLCNCCPTHAQLIRYFVKYGNVVWRKDVSDVRKYYFRMLRTPSFLLIWPCISPTWAKILYYSPISDIGSNFFNTLQVWISLFFWNQVTKILWPLYLY